MEKSWAGPSQAALDQNEINNCISLENLHKYLFWLTFSITDCKVIIISHTNNTIRNISYKDYLDLDKGGIHYDKICLRDGSRIGI